MSTRRRGLRWEGHEGKKKDKTKKTRQDFFSSPLTLTGLLHRELNHRLLVEVLPEHSIAEVDGHHRRRAPHNPLRLLARMAPLLTTPSTWPSNVGSISIVVTVVTSACTGPSSAGVSNLIWEETKRIWNHHHPLTKPPAYLEEVGRAAFTHLFCCKDQPRCVERHKKERGANEAVDIESLPSINRQNRAGAGKMYMRDR